MFNIFKKNRILSDDDYQFQFETYAWLLKYFGGDAFYKDTMLVLPTEEFFPESVEESDEIAETTFRYVKKYANMEDWPCELRAQEPDPDRKVAPTVIIQGGEDSPLGTFSTEDSKSITITYNPAIVSDPTQLVATLAHELAHYLTGSCKIAPPGGWENWEFATDIAAVFMGFGIFMANSAFSFNQFTDVDTQGWNTSRSGYLTEAEFSFSLALFLMLKKINPKEILPFLDTNVKSYLKKSLKELNGSQAYFDLRKVECVSIS